MIRCTLLLLALVACGRTDSVLDRRDVATCETACVRLAELGCPEARMTPDGTTCPTACHRAERYVDLRHACIVHAASVDDVRACGTVRCVE